MENENNEVSIVEAEKPNRTPVLQSFADNWKI